MFRTWSLDLNWKELFLLWISLAKTGGLFFRLIILLTKISFDPDILCPSFSKHF